MSVPARLDRYIETEKQRHFSRDFMTGWQDYETWDEATVGSHAGIKDTSQLLYVKPEDVRLDRINDSFTNKRESGISGWSPRVRFGLVRAGLSPVPRSRSP